MAVAVGATTSVENDSYCGEGDVVALLQMGTDYTSGTIPTEAQVLNFMGNRAGEIYGWMRAIVGSSAPGPASYSTTLDTGTDAGKALQYLLVQTNAYGAAFDALEAAGATSTPARTERAAELFAMYYDSKAQIEMLVSEYTGYANSVSNHFSEGSVTSATLTARKNETSFPFDTDTTW